MSMNWLDNLYQERNDLRAQLEQAKAELEQERNKCQWNELCQINADYWVGLQAENERLRSKMDDKCESCACELLNERDGLREEREAINECFGGNDTTVEDIQTTVSEMRRLLRFNDNEQALQPAPAGDLGHEEVE